MRGWSWDISRNRGVEVANRIRGRAAAARGSDREEQRWAVVGVVVGARSPRTRWSFFGATDQLVTSEQFQQRSFTRHPCFLLPDNQVRRAALIYYRAGRDAKGATGLSV
jgi:hypothetical protein